MTTPVPTCVRCGAAAISDDVEKIREIETLLSAEAFKGLSVGVLLAILHGCEPV